MILTDREIGSAIKHGSVKIDPPPSADAYSSTSVDLTLSRHFTSWQATPGVIIAPGRPGYSYNNLTRYQTPHDVDHYRLGPQQLVLAWTAEEIEIPMQSRLAARVEGKSSLARIGIGIHVTAPTIHCGFKGQIQLEMFNFGPHEIELDAGMKVCQLIFEQTLGTPEKGYSGSFYDQHAGDQH